MECGVASGQCAEKKGRRKNGRAGRYKTVARRRGFLWNTVSRRFVEANGTRGGAGRGIARAACAEAVTRHFCETQGVCGGKGGGRGYVVFVVVTAGWLVERNVRKCGFR